MAVAILPARGGSQGIPRKNVRPFRGKPLLAWSIQQCFATREIQATYVTSDSEEILELAEKLGAKAIVRPKEISGDRASSESALEHALSVIPGWEDLDLVAFLQPTSPLRKPDDLSRAIHQFRVEGCDSLFSAAALEDFLIWEKSDTGELRSFNYDFKNRGRRQDRKSQYVENGSFYLFKPEVLKGGNRLGGKVGMFMQDFWQSFEIDHPEDWELVETLFALHLETLYKGRRAAKKEMTLG